MRHDIYVNGRPVGEVGATVGLKFSHGRSYGPLRASWRMDPVRHPNLFWGASVLIMLGGCPVWWGFLNEPGRDGAMSALGLWEQGKGAQCLDATFATTAEPRDAVAQAIARGRLRWSSPVPNIYAGGAAQQMDAPYPLQSIVALLDRVAGEQGVSWFIDSFTGALATASNPTAPTWLVPALVAGQGLTPADDDVATHLVAEYLDAPGSRKPAGPVASPDYIPGAPSVEQRVDLIDKGFITAGQATAYMTNMFGQGVGSVGWADSLLLGWGDVLTMGGQPTEPSAVVAGSMGRLAGVWDDRAASPATDTDIVADETEFDEDANTVQVTPLGKAKRTLGEAMTWIP